MYSEGEQEDGSNCFISVRRKFHCYIIQIFNQMSTKVMHYKFPIFCYNVYIFDSHYS